MLALSEAVSNAVEHGYGVRPGVVAPPDVVEVAAEVLAEGRVEIIVRDRGGWRSPSQMRAWRNPGAGSRS